MKNNYLDIVRSVIPEEGGELDLSALYQTPIGKHLRGMEATEQPARYHAEGNVLNHTVRVLKELLASEGYKSENEEGRFVLFLASLLHDIGKIASTRLENGEWTSPRHTIVGANMARELLWKEMGLSGDRESVRLREAVCQLIRYHSYPPYSMKDEDDLKIHRIAENGTLTDAFSIRRLITLERADVFGRIGESVNDMAEKVSYCEMMAEELGILDTPYRFSSDYSKRAYYKKRLSWRGGDLYNPTPFEVILMAGLPGTGKDTYIKKHFGSLPMISLDEIRERIGVSPTENQAPVITVAHSEARELLRKQIPFVWNATSITADLRSKQISLFEGYGASVRCIYLETEWEEELRRNAERERNVPVAVIERMLSRLELPEAYECEKVEWVCV